MKYCMRGGLIKGPEIVKGNSPKNDVVDVMTPSGVKIKASGGEIMMDKETLAKGPEAWVNFIKTEMQKNPHIFKKHFYDGGTAGPSYVDQSIAEGVAPNWVDKLHDSLMSTPSKRYDAYNRRVNSISGQDVPPKPKNQQTTSQSGYAKGGLIEGGDERDNPLFRKKKKRSLAKPKNDEGMQKFKDGGTVQPDFDPKAYLASKAASSDFDPKAYLAEKSGAKPETSTSDKLQTAAENFGQGLTGGYLPQIQAAIQPVSDKIFGAIIGDHPEPESYVKSRDENIRRIESESSRNPKSAVAGQVAGVVTGAALTPELGGAGVISKAARGAAAGAAYGAAQNPGDVEGVVNPIQGKERLENAKTGAEFGAAGALIEKGVGAMRNSADSAQKFANAQAVKAAGGTLKDMRQIQAKGKIDELGQFALDNKIVEAGDTVKDVAKKAESFRQKVGDDLDAIYGKAKQAMEQHGAQGVEGAPGVGTPQITGFNPAQNKDQILSAVSEQLGDSPAKAKAVSTVRKYLGQLERDYGDQVLDPKKANDIKTAVDKEINYARNPLTKNPAAEEGYSVLRNYINEAVKSHVEQLGAASGDPELAKKLVNANKAYGNARQFQNMADDRIARDMANKTFGLTDTIAGTGGAAAGYVAGEHSGHGMEGAIAGFMAGAAHKSLGKYGASTMASMANKAAPVLDKSAVPISEFLARSPKDFATKAAIQELMLNRKVGK